MARPDTHTHKHEGRGSLRTTAGLFVNGRFSASKATRWTRFCALKSSYFTSVCPLPPWGHLSLDASGEPLGGVVSGYHRPIWQGAWAVKAPFPGGAGSKC